MENLALSWSQMPLLAQQIVEYKREQLQPENRAPCGLIGVPKDTIGGLTAVRASTETD